MADHKSAAKRARQNLKRRARNRSATTVVRNEVLGVTTALVSKTGDELKSALKSAVSAIDKARASGILHRNNAARKISRLTRHVQAALKKA